MTAAVLLAGALLLLGSAVTHLRAPGSLRRALAAHGVLPSGAARSVALALPPLQVLAGGAGLVVGLAWVGGARPSLGRTVALSIALLYAAYALYLSRAWVRVTPGEVAVPCGCGLGTEPLGGWHVARAALLAVGCAVAGISLGGPLPSGPAQQAVVALAGLAFAVLAAALPGARSSATDDRASARPSIPGMAR